MIDKPNSRDLPRLWLEIQPSVLSFICAAVPRFCDAEDLLQETALEATEHFDQYDQSRPFIAWVLGIARFKIAAFYRKQGHSPCLLAETAFQLVLDEHVTQHETLDDRRVALEECLEALPDGSQNLVKGRYQQNLDSIELAKLTDSTCGSVRVKLSRIRSQLLDCIKFKLSQGGAS
jgi:RNA polymerase sigma-70 factor (ECF subfamily)